MLIDDKRKTTVPKRHAADIPVGAVFTATILDHAGPFLRTYDNVVDLSSPNKTWPVCRQRGPTFEHYREVRVRVVIED